MQLIFGDTQVPVEIIITRNEMIKGARRDVIEIWAYEPLSPEVIDYIKNGTEFTDDLGRVYRNYNTIVRYSTWLAQTDPNALIVEEMTLVNEGLVAEQAVLIEAKQRAIEAEQIAVQEKQNIQFIAIPNLLRGRQDDIIIEMIDYILDWQPGIYLTGDVYKDNNYPYICVQGHDSTENLDWNPANTPAMWAPYHAQSLEYALEWIQPTGAQDMYKAGEYMIFTNGEIYECLSDTNFSPADLPSAWHNVNSGPTPDPEPEEPVDPEEPGAKNSNGTDIWSEWLAWDSNPATLYNVGDLVTHNEIRYISTQLGNHWEPGVYGWDVVPV